MTAPPTPPSGSDPFGGLYPHYPNGVPDLVKEIEYVRSKEPPEINEGINSIIGELRDRRTKTLSTARLKLWMRSRNKQSPP